MGRFSRRSLPLVVEMKTATFWQRFQVFLRYADLPGSHWRLNGLCGARWLLFGEVAKAKTTVARRQSWRAWRARFGWS